VPPVRSRPPRAAPSATFIAGAAALLVVAIGVGVAAAAGLLRPAPRPAPVAGLPRPVAGTVGRPAAVDSLRVTVVSASSDTPDDQQGGQGDRLVTVQVRCENAGTDGAIVSPFDWVVTDSSGAVYTAAPGSGSTDLPQRALPPGARTAGVVRFRVPPSSHGLVLRFNAEVGDGSVAVPLDVG
jgi:hypothetical protein